MQKESDYRTNSRVQGPSLREWPSRGDGERTTTPVTGEKFRFLFLFDRGQMKVRLATRDGREVAGCQRLVKIFDFGFPFGTERLTTEEGTI
jgi:hypothetical protein